MAFPLFTFANYIIRDPETATEKEVNCKEVEYIKYYNSNNPSTGYNQWPKFKHD